MNAEHGNRIQWIDVLKCMGIFEILVGHFGVAAGHWYPFVFTHHVPLFFFVSGCMESLRTRPNFSTNLIKKTKTILVPFYVFALLFIAVSALCNDDSARSVLKLLYGALVGGGERNDAYGALWFLTCLWLVGIVFNLIRLVQNKFVLLALAFGFYTFFEFVINPSPLYLHMAYNIDEVMLYLPYYIVGYVAFPYIRDLLSEPTEKKPNLLVIITSGITCFLYSAAIFFGIDPLVNLWQIQYIGQVLLMIRPLIIIWAIVILSYLLRNVVLFQELGKGTLYICGNESTAKIIISAVLGLFGLTIAPQNPLQVFIYSAFLMVLINNVLKPIEEGWMHFIQKQLDKLLSRFRVAL